MANGDSTHSNPDALPPESETILPENDFATFRNKAKDAFDDLWRIFYAISGCEYAIAQLSQGVLTLEDPAYEKVGGIGLAIALLAKEGERIADKARDGKFPLAPFPFDSARD